MKPKKQKKNQATLIIEKFSRGGTVNGDRIVADLLGLHRTTVICWRTRSGKIPLAYAVKLLDAATSVGVELTIDDLLY